MCLLSISVKLEEAVNFLIEHYLLFDVFPDKQWRLEDAESNDDVWRAEEITLEHVQVSLLGKQTPSFSRTNVFRIAAQCTMRRSDRVMNGTCFLGRYS